MGECIEREAVLRAVQGQRSPCRSPAQNRMLDCLKAAVIRISAADVAPVVRCKDCKHLRVWNQKDIYAFCPKTNIVFFPFELDTRTFFCGFGERKDGGNADENRDPEN